MKIPHDTNEKIKMLIARCDPSARVVETERVSGGLSHNMYHVQTDKADFAIKELNPTIMRREEAYRNFVFSEKVARVIRQNGINAVCALQFDGEVVLSIEDSYFMIFDCVNGSVLKPEQVEEAHCEIIGQTLARIHNINFSESQNFPPQNMQAEMYDFESYILSFKDRNGTLAQKLQDDIDLLSKLNRQAAAATAKLNGVLTVSHRDLDCKNVIWQHFTPFLIDWESSGFINPTLELVQVAWYWAGGDAENIDLHKFTSLIKSYAREYRGKICAEYDDLVYANMNSKLAWLNYNLQRVLEDTDCESAKLANSEIDKSLKEINYCVEQFDNVIAILKTCF